MIDFVNLPGVFEAVHDYTMGTPSDVAYMVGAVMHVCRNDTPGAIVECGVWKGGELRAAQLALENGGWQREVWAYDTFAGMVPISREDVNSFGGTSSQDEVGKLVVSVETVKQLLGESVHYVVGDVRKTAWEQAPDRIAVLRLDTDWYESTRETLRALYPLLSIGGVLLIDDYNFWPGCRKATDEYFGAESPRLTNAGTGVGMVKVV